MEKSPEAFRTISEVASDLDVPQHVLRFWESKFSQIKPMKRGGGRRYYRPQDVDLLRGIRYLLYGEGYTIRGVQKILRENGVAYVIECATAEGRARIADAGRASGDGAQDTGQGEEGMVDAAQKSGLTREQVQVLQATLYELSELKRMVDEGTGE